MDKETKISAVNTTPAAQMQPAPDTAKGLKRRALLRAGAGAAPVLLTLASGPVAATTCTVASSFVSVATFKSRNPHVTSIACSSRTADYWKHGSTHFSPPPADMLLTVGALMGSTSSQYNAHTVQAAFMLPSVSSYVETTGEIGTLHHLLALMLNLRAGHITAAGVFNQAYVQGIWANYKANGNRYKVAPSNIDWGDAELIAWLRYLMYPALVI
jgi:hypothetical protein